MSDPILEPWSHALPHAGLTLRGWRTAPSGRPLIHFLHGNGFCGRTYEPMLRRLAQDFDLWLADIQGHGDSDRGPRFLGWNRNAELALEAFEAHRGAYGPVPLYAVGHSFGGVLTALILARAAQPFRRAVLLDPVLFPPAMAATLTVVGLARLGHRTPLARAALRRRRHWPSRDAAFAALHGRGAYKGWTDEALRAFVDHALRERPAEGAEDEAGGVELKCDPALEARIFGSGPRGLWNAVDRIRVPTLIAHGVHTMPFVTTSAAHATSVNGAIHARQVAGGHCFMQEDPQAGAALVRDFLLAHR